MYKCPNCGGKIVAYYLIPEVAYIYDITSKPDINGFLDREFIEDEYIFKILEEVFSVCICYDCGKEFPADSLEEFGKKYAHLWVGGED